MTFFALSLSATFVACAVATACGKSSEQPCTPATEGFGDAEAIPRTVLVEQERAQGPCRPRLEILRNADDVRKATEEAAINEVTGIDFSRDRVLLREGEQERGVRWLVARGDAVIVGTQGCTAQPPVVCFIELYKVTASSATATEHMCPSLPCGGIPPEP